MKNISIKILVALLAIVTLNSCLDDGEEYKQTYYWFGIAESTDSTDDLGYRVLFDNGLCGYPVSSTVTSIPADSDRVYMSFELASDWEDGDSTIYLDVQGYSVISVKDLVTYDSIAADTLGADPICLYEGYAWQTSHIMNFIYYLKYDYPAMDHFVNLVYYPDSVVDGGGVYLKLQHNANDDGTTNTSDEIISCFDMTSIDAFANVVDSVPYVIEINSGYFSNAESLIEGYYYKPTN